MKLLVVTLAALLSFAASAQSRREYLDENKKILSGLKGAFYYREFASKRKRYVVRDFYTSNDQLAMEAECSEIRQGIRYDGMYKTYFRNGQLMEVGTYNDNTRRGLWKRYYENGQQEEEIIHEEDQVLHQQHWDESGNEHLINGSGHFVERHSMLGDIHTEILDHLQIASYSLHPVTADSIYLVVQETATYDGGMPALYEMIGQELQYPADARDKGIQGKVFVEFVIEEDGSVTNVKVIKGPGGGLNEEAERVVKMMDKWIPGKVKGKPVAQRIVMPLSFKLG